MEPLLFTSIEDYEHAGPLPWLDGCTSEDKDTILKIIKTGINDELSYTKIASQINSELPKFKVKSPYPHATWISTEIVLTEMRIRMELDKFEGAVEKYKHNFVMEKKWNIVDENSCCDICLKNSSVGWIPLFSPFPSGHLFAPAHNACRCNTTTKFGGSLVKESGLPKDRWIVERVGDTIKIKPNPKYQA